MKLEDLVDIEKFIESVTPPDKTMFEIWSSTAFEISSESYKDIAMLRQIYLEIPDIELRPRQIISFIEELLRVLPSDEDRKTLVRAEALQFRKFELPP